MGKQFSKLKYVFIEWWDKQASQLVINGNHVFNKSSRCVNEYFKIILQLEKQDN